VRLSSVMIGTADTQPLVEYYTKLFGEPRWQDGTFAGWELGDGGVAVGPHDKVSGKNAHPGRVIWNIESADVQADFARLRDAGGTVVLEPYEAGPGMWVATFADPDDNYFQLVSPM